MAQKILHGDCYELLKNIKNNSINLIITSPPYADQRKKTYGGIHPDQYVDWFLPISKELFRVLMDDDGYIREVLGEETKWTNDDFSKFKKYHSKITDASILNSTPEDIKQTAINSGLYS